jgi:hypothetical protein
MYDDNMKGFLKNLAVALGGTVQEAAFETIRVAMHAPGLASLLPAGAEPPPLVIPTGFTPTATVNVDPYLAELNAKQAIIESQGREIALLQAKYGDALAEVATAVPATASAPAPARKRAASAFKVTEVSIDGVATPVKSWKQAVIVAVSRVVEDGRVTELPVAWFSPTEKAPITTMIEDGFYLLSNMSADMAQNRLAKIATLGYNVQVA